MEGLEQTNSFFTSTNYAVMLKLAKMTAMVNVMQAQLKNLSAAFKKFNKTKYKILLLELRDKFHSWEQIMLIKEIRT